MAYQSVGLGSSADDGGGDTLRSGGTKINANFLEIYNLLGDGSDLTSGLGISGSQVTLTTPIIAEIDSSSTITLDATTDIVLDADGGDIFFKDAGTTFGSANNNSGNLIVKSGTTTALTFSGANATVAGTLASGAITSSGVVTGSGFTVGSAVITEAELETIDGITAGTAAASKALVLDSSTNISGIGTISSGAITSSGVVTATGFTIGSAVINEAELETIDGITGGTVIASKAVVVDANKDIGIIRNLTIDGVFTDGNYTFDTSGNVSGLGTIGSGAITSTGVVTATGFTIGSAVINEAELETLDGITAGTAAGSKAVVLDASKDIGTIRNLTIDGTFSDGNYTFDTSGNVSGLGTVASGAITSTGVVTGTGFTIGSAVINEAELEQIDGITAGTVSTSKAVVVDSNSNIAGFGTIGSGAITSTGVVTATGFTIGSAVIIEAELETLDGITAGTAAGSKAVVLDANKDIGTLRNITLSGELDAGSLDVSGNADIDGTLEADAITVNGVTLAEYIADTTGAMVTSNTETGITVTYEDGDNTLDFALGAAQTTITSLLATDIKIGEDNDTKMDFETANEIHFYASAAEQVYVADGVFGPQTDSDVDLGTTGVRWKDAFIDTVTTTGAITSAGLVTAGSLNLGDDTVTTLKSGTYTPTWVAASGTAPAIGNGSLTGRYTQIGSLCHVLIKIYFGSSSTFGNGGVLRFGLPFTAATISGMAHVGSGSYIINDSGTGTTGGTVELGSALAYITLNCNPSGTVGATLATNAVPLTWANGDSLTVECLYEV